MNDNCYSGIKKEIIALLKRKGQGSLESLSRYCCSELTRLTFCWLMRRKKIYSGYIIKGNRILGRLGLSHDILVIKDNHGIHLIDPSIWQIFPRKRKIYLGSANNIKGALTLAESIYAGKWGVSERLGINDCYNTRINDLTKAILENKD